MGPLNPCTYICINAPLLICLTLQLRLSFRTLMTNIFVYGTLKKGQPNHYRMLDSANGKTHFLASACTTQKYPLVIAGKYNIPYLLDVPGQGHRIQGEIYKVDERMLTFLDDFEMVPTQYQRVPVELEVKEAQGHEALKAGAVTEAFAYIRKTFEPDTLELENFESYDSRGAHGLLYVTREARD